MAALAAGFIGASAVAGAVYLIAQGGKDGWGWLLFIAFLCLFALEEIGGAK
ncbi:hypothetical protein PsAD2_02964 [Pseudovibrio axinellae]|uniref:Uncharacterized protein n=1 Tax=Pseudovibrio axinellae TaxID=989403 RepID=A0A165XED9_9HYPH|nr:hypothetical protein [Pseudovibrio axinellae]KZL17628.1 hypothetical protein PsAD2_02964 [Pseudovibrio axinellae]SER45749.1 hypothetical protein SAMN05421798_110118 [Pseudovibrio axinellae]